MTVSELKVLYECKRHTKYGSRSRSGHERSLGIFKSHIVVM